MAKVKIVTLFLIILIMFSTLITFEARPEPAFPIQTQKGGELLEQAEMVEESCEGVEKEECLMRRTLAAHTDYIYSQRNNKP